MTSRPSLYSTACSNKLYEIDNTYVALLVDFTIIKTTDCPRLPPRAARDEAENCANIVPNYVSPVVKTCFYNAVNLAVDASVTIDCTDCAIYGNVAGDQTYIGDSHVCTAAFFEGRLTKDKTTGQLIGSVTLKSTGPQLSFITGTNNGITTTPYGGYPYSFVFLPEEADACQSHKNPCNSANSHCVLSRNGNAQCVCGDGWFGSKCDQQVGVSACSPNPCNGGTVWF